MRHDGFHRRRIKRADAAPTLKQLDAERGYADGLAGRPMEPNASGHYHGGYTLGSGLRLSTGRADEPVEFKQEFLCEPYTADRDQQSR